MPGSWCVLARARHPARENSGQVTPSHGSGAERCAGNWWDALMIPLQPRDHGRDESEREPARCCLQSSTWRSAASNWKSWGTRCRNCPKWSTERLSVGWDTHPDDDRCNNARTDTAPVCSAVACPGYRLLRSNTAWKRVRLPCGLGTRPLPNLVCLPASYKVKRWPNFFSKPRGATEPHDLGVHGRQDITSALLYEPKCRTISALVDRRCRFRIYRAHRSRTRTRARLRVCGDLCGEAAVVLAV